MHTKTLKPTKSPNHSQKRRQKGLVAKKLRRKYKSGAQEINRNTRIPQVANAPMTKYSLNLHANARRATLFVYMRSPHMDR